MKTALYPFMCLAACGLALSIGAHCMALAGTAIPGGNLVWGLHVGVFVVWIPTVLVSMRLARHVGQKDLWKIALSGCPAWMRYGVYALFIYAVLNFALFFAATASRPSHMAGTADSPSVIRGFSGHWMIFYGAAFAVLYSATHAPGLFHTRICPQGHEVSPLARFCPLCGSALSDKPESA